MSLNITRDPHPDPADGCCICGEKDEGYYIFTFGGCRHLLCDACAVGLADMLTPSKHGLSLRAARKRLREKIA